MTLAARVLQSGHSYLPHTVDGKNSAPVDMVNIPLFTGFHTSKVVQDFFHQQYHVCQFPTLPDLNTL